jgi:hypothetical protein
MRAGWKESRLYFKLSAHAFLHFPHQVGGGRAKLTFVDWCKSSLKATEGLLISPPAMQSLSVCLARFRL